MEQSTKGSGMVSIKPGSHWWDKHKHKHKYETYAHA